MLDLAKGAGLLLVLALAGCVSKPTDLQSLNWSKDQQEPAFSPVFFETNPPVVVRSVPQPGLAPAPAYKGDSETDAFPETWVSLKRWCKVKGLEAPTNAVLRGAAASALKSGQGTFILQVGSQLAYWNGIQIQLGFAPQAANEDVLVHSLDLRKTVHPLLLSGSRSGSPNPVVVIDPGHGGEDSGAVSVVGRGREKDFALDWARRLQALLVTNGWKAFLTHANDQDMALTNRVTFADQQRADYFVSLHFNSANSGSSQAGLETYCLTPVGLPSNLTRGFADDPAQSFPNNAWDAESLSLAARVHRSLLAVAGMPDRGVRRARFMTVLRGQQRPAILVEGGYLSNPTEARKIADPEYRQKLAEGIAWALLGRHTIATTAPVAAAPESLTSRP